MEAKNQKELKILIKEPIPKEIEFYGKKNQFGFLSNFFPSRFTVNGKIYQTVEHYFQSKKFEGKHMQDIIRQAQNPAEAFRLGRHSNVPLRQDWEQVKQKIMFEALLHKFTQNQDLRKALKLTGNSKIIQHTNKDKYWADGSNGKGLNRLGILLMQIREVIKQQK